MGEKIFSTNIRTEKSWGFPVRDLIPARAFYKLVSLPKIAQGQDPHLFTNPDGKSGWGYTSGWNHSYHAAAYDPKIFAWGKGKKKFQRANAMMQLARAWYEEQTLIDPTIARFNARRQVRAGD